MVRVQRTIRSYGRRSCVVILEPSGEEFLLRPGHAMEMAAEVEEGRSIEVEEYGNQFVVHVPIGGVTLLEGNRPAEGPCSLLDIVELEIAKLPPEKAGFDVTDEFVAQMQTFALEDLSPVNPTGKLGILEIAAQTSMELYKLRPQVATHATLIAAVCRRVLGVGAILVQSPPSEFAPSLWSAAKSDVHLGAEPKSIRRLLATCCVYPESINDDVRLWGAGGGTTTQSAQEEQADVEE